VIRVRIDGGAFGRRYVVVRGAARANEHFM